MAGVRSVICKELPGGMTRVRLVSVRPVIREYLLDRGEMLMPFVGTSDREAPSVRYEKIGRFCPGDNAVIEII